MPLQSIAAKMRTQGRPAAQAFIGTALKQTKKAALLALASKDQRKTLGAVHGAMAALEGAEWALEYELTEAAEAIK